MSKVITVRFGEEEQAAIEYLMDYYAEKGQVGTTTQADIIRYSVRQLFEQIKKSSELDQ